MQTAIATLRQLPETTEQLEAFVNYLINEALSGVADPLVLAGQLKILSEISDMVRKNEDVKEMVLDELRKYGSGVHVIYGKKWKIKPRKTYDLSCCGDPVYDDLITESKALDKKIKERETFLKALKTEMVDPANGIVISPPTFTVSEYYELTFAK